MKYRWIPLVWLMMACAIGPSPHPETGKTTGGKRQDPVPRGGSSADASGSVPNERSQCEIEGGSWSTDSDDCVPPATPTAASDGRTPPPGEADAGAADGWIGFTELEGEAGGDEGPDTTGGDSEATTGNDHTGPD